MIRSRTRIRYYLTFTEERRSTGEKKYDSHNWFNKSRSFAAGQAIAYFEETSNKNIKNIAAYHLQQATEKLIKYQIYQATANPNNAKLYTHNIEKLIIYADSIDIGIDIPAYVRKRSLEITEWEAGSRYDIGFSTRIDTLKRTYSELEKWVDRI